MAIVDGVTRDYRIRMQEEGELGLSLLIFVPRRTVDHLRVRELAVAEPLRLPVDVSCGAMRDRNRASPYSLASELRGCGRIIPLNRQRRHPKFRQLRCAFASGCL